MRIPTLAALEDALLARVEQEVCAQAGHRFEPVLGGGRWCRTCCLYEPRLPAQRTGDSREQSVRRP